MCVSYKMGYSYYSPLIMFGFIEDYNDRNGVFLESSWVYENYKDVYCYATEINKNFNIGNGVGIVCKLSAEDGKVKYEDGDFQSLMKFKEAYEKYHNTKVALEYFTAISGDYENEGTYTLED
jgi:hypothetical protein